MKKNISLFLSLIILLMIGGCDVNYDTLENNPVYEKRVIEGHTYILKKGTNRITHAGNCPKCREDLIFIVDSIIKSNI